MSAPDSTTVFSSVEESCRSTPLRKMRLCERPKITPYEERKSVLFPLNYAKSD